MTGWIKRPCSPLPLHDLSKRQFVEPWHAVLRHEGISAHSLPLPTQCAASKQGIPQPHPCVLQEAAVGALICASLQAEACAVKVSQDIRRVG